MPCICDQCELFAQATCPRVSPDGKEMCLSFQGAQTNSLQQLRAEIAACIPSLVESYNHMRDSQFNACIEKLRQLSAV
jgi:hypothetical protein